MSAQPVPIEVLYSYADADEDLCNELDKHLSVLQTRGLITAWHKRHVEAGTDWTRAVDSHLGTASIILFLVSSDFLSSNYCSGTEVMRAMERHHKGEARVLPILLRSVDWQGTPFEKLKALPENGIPVTSWRNRDEAMTSVARGIRAALQDIQSELASPPITTKPSIWNIPYPRNPFFTGRDELLTRLSTALKSGQATALSQAQAISGLGGIGKTQVAIEFAYQYTGDYQAVFWTLSDTRESLVSGYVAIARLLDLPEKDEQDQTRAVEAVKRWFTTHTEWLLILDNVEDLMLVNAFLPPSFGGHLLLTTRVQATGTQAKRIEVDSMSQDVGALFLLRRAKLLVPDAQLTDAAAEDQVVAREICEELGGLPLALDQAGAYVEETGCGLLGYQSLYRTQRAEMLKERGNFASEYPKSVATTWSLSFKRVEEQSPAAADLLRLVAFLAPDAIPEELLMRGGAFLGPVLESVVADPRLLNKVMRVLLSYSLIRREGSKKMLSVHRLVQVVILDGMETQELEQWIERVVRVLNRAFPEGTFEKWSQCERYLPHVLVCTNWIEEHKAISPSQAGSLLSKAGVYLRERGQYSLAEPLLVRALAIREQHLGTNHPDTATNLHTLATLYWNQGKYSQAESLYQRALSIREHKLGTEHPDTAKSLNNLANLYNDQGKYNLAEPLYLRAIAIKEQHLGAEHPDTAKSLNNLAALYYRQGKYEQAELLYRRAIAIYERQLGAEHPSTAESMGNLAEVYQAQGKYSQAEPLYQRALAVSEQHLGAEHPRTAECLNNLAEVYRAQGKYSQAESLYQRALSIREQHLGAEHPDTATVLNNLAALYREQGRYAEAESTCIRALSIREQHLGTNHPDTATSLHTLATLCWNQGKYSQAESLYQRALSIREHKLGIEHPDTAKSLNNLANLYNDQGKYSLAEPLYQRAIVIKEHKPGAEHPDTAKSLNNLAVLYYRQGKYEQAELLYRRTLSIYEHKLGAEHPNTAESQENLAEVYRAQGKYSQAEPLYQRSLAVSERHLGAEHPRTAESLNNLAEVYRVQGKHSQAEPLYQRALSIREQHLGAEHPDTATVLNNLAALYREQGRYAEAESTCIRALSIREQHLGAEHPDTARSLNNLATLYYDQEKYGEAEPLFKQALLICKQTLGETHPDTRSTQEWYVSLLRKMGRNDKAAATLETQGQLPSEEH